MPIYEYRCQKCGHQLEIMQKVSDPAPEKCPSCGADTSLERLMSRTSFQLKGGGWYSDLYGSTKKDGSSGSGSSGSGSSGGGSSGGSSGGASGSGTSGGTGSSGGSSSGSTGSGSGGGTTASAA